MASTAATPYRVDHAGGTWAALALHASQGTLYPPLFESGPFGSRYMPIPIAAHAAAALGTGETLLAGRLIDLIALAAISALVAVSLRRCAVPSPLIGLVIAAPLLTEPGLENILGMRHDGVAVSLQLGAFLAIDDDGRIVRAAVTGLLVALAILASLTALWAGAAIVAWLILRGDLRRLAVVGGSGVVVLLAGVLVTSWFSDGRFLVSLLTPGLGPEAPPGVGGPLPGLPRLIEQVLTTAPSVAILLPIIVAVLPTVRWRHAEGLYALAVGLAFLELVVVFGDRGVFGNHLLSLAVLAPLFVMIMAVRAISAVRVMTVAALAAGGVFAFQLNVADDLVASVTDGLSVTESHPPLAAYVSDDVSILSEDPGVEVFHGRVPTLLDPYMVRRMAERNPSSVDDLVNRIQGGAFDLVVTIYPLNSDPRWYRLYHFGERISSAIADAYAFDTYADGYYLYRPLEPPP